MNYRSIDSFQIGETAEQDVAITEDLVVTFTKFTGDDNPLHIDAAYAATTVFKRRVAHGLSYASLFSRIIGVQLPGPGSLWLSQNFQFEKPVYIGDHLRLKVEILTISPSSRTVNLLCTAANQYDELVMKGEGTVQVLERVVEHTGPLTTTNPSSQRRIAVVTGGSRGIGAEVARRLGSDGYRLVVTFKTSREEAHSLAQDIGNAFAIEADAGDPDSSRRIVSVAKEKFGASPDTLVLCACDRAIYGAAAENDFDDFERHWRTQVAGTHALVSACLPDMKARKHGSIIGIGTTYALERPPANMSPYIVSKAALSAYIRCLAAEYGQFGIRANIVAPSMTETALLASVPERQRKVAARENPLRRLATAGDVAGVVSFLASADASYITGETILITGGSLMR